MKLLATILFIVFSLCTTAQDSLETHLSGDTLLTRSGFKVVPKDMLKMGTGSMPDGDFKFIRRSATSLFQYTSNGGYQGLANQANALSRSANGLSYKVVRIDKRGSKKNGYVYFPIINIGAIRYEVDIDNAIASGELAVPEVFKPKKEGPTVIVQQGTSVADELTKLKKLYEDGTLTKDEYEGAKKKLLEKQ